MDTKRLIKQYTERSGYEDSLVYPQRSSLIAGLDCGLDRWTGLLDWILKERCQTSMQDCMCSEDLYLARSYRRS